jgi:hypothetical protein
MGALLQGLWVMADDWFDPFSDWPDWSTCGKMEGQLETGEMVTGELRVVDVTLADEDIPHWAIVSSDGIEHPYVNFDRVRWLK